MRVDLRRRAAAADRGRRRRCCAGVTGPRARRSRRDDAAVDAPHRRRSRGPRRRSRRSCPPTRRPRVGAAADGDGRVYLDHARDIGAFNPCFPEYEHRASTATAATGHGHVPARLRGPARHRPRRLPRRVLRLRRPAPQLRRRASPARRPRSRVRYRRPTPLAHRRCTFDDRARRSTTAASRSTARLLADGDGAVRGARSSAVAGDRAALPDGLAPAEPRRDRRRRSTPATACRSPSPRCCARGSPSARRRRAARLRRRRRSPTPTPSAARPRWREALLAAGAGTGTHVGLLHPNGPDVRRRPGSPRPASAPSACRSARSRPAPSSRACCATPTSRCCSRAASYRSHDYVGAPARRPSPGSTSPRRRRCCRRSVPALRRIAFVDAGATASIRLDAWRSLVAGGAVDRATTCSPRPRRRSAPADRMVDRAHLGLDQRAEGRDPHRTAPLIRHLDNLNQLRRYDARRGAVLELAVLLDRRLRLRAARHAGRRRDARLLERARRRRRARRARARAPDDGERLRRVGRPPAATTRRFAEPRPVVDPARQPLPDHAGRRPARPTPSCATTCSA